MLHRRNVIFKCPSHFCLISVTYLIFITAVQLFIIRMPLYVSVCVESLNVGLKSKKKDEVVAPFLFCFFNLLTFHSVLHNKSHLLPDFQ